MAQREFGLAQVVKLRNLGLSARPAHDWEGRTYPLIVVDVGAASNPFWTGSRRHIDAAPQVVKFRRRYGRRS